MKVLVVSEGIHELGSEHPGSERISPLSRLVERICGDAITLELSHAKLNDPRRARVQQGKGGPFLKKTLAWLREAEREGHEALVLVMDRDDDSSRIRQFDEAQADSRIGLRRAFGVAIRSFDAWILADETALSKALGAQVPCQKSPEEDPDPKETCIGLCKSSPTPPRLRDLYADVLGAVSIDRLEERCPNGFGPFRKRVEALTRPLPKSPAI